MMPKDPYQLIAALVEAEMVAEQREAHRYLPKGPLVTVAHELGSGGQAIAKELSERIHVPYYDQAILEAMVKEMPEDEPLLKRLDQQVSDLREEVVRQVLVGKSGFEAYRKALMDVILGIGRQGGVIVGREAHLILSHYKAFRVRIVASEETCARRLAEREGLSMEEAKEKVREVRRRHEAFVRQIFGRELNDPTAFDLILNTDHIPLSGAVDVILEAMRQSGYILEAPKTRSNAA